LGRTLDQLTQTPAQAARFLENLKTIRRDGEKIGPQQCEFHR
jgi:hypothetical protein